MAIPLNLIAERISYYLEEVIYENSDIGLVATDIRPQDYTKLGLARPVGALVADIGANSLSELSGLRVDDVIVTVAGEIVESNAVLIELINRNHQPDPVKVTVIRSGSYFSTSMQL